MVFTTETLIFQSCSFQPHYLSSSSGQKSRSDSWLFSFPHIPLQFMKVCWCYSPKYSPNPITYHYQPCSSYLCLNFSKSLLNDLSASTLFFLVPILHRAARMIYSKPKSDHVTLQLKTLQWILIPLDSIQTPHSLEGPT